MDDILIYSDSLTWGLIPDTRNRLSFEKRWPGVFETAFKENGFNVRVIENCLNGRRTAWDDPFKAGRNGSQGLAQVVEMHSPLKLIIVMLGTNDFQSSHNNSAGLSGQGVAKLIGIIRQAPIEPGMPIPEIMLVVPPKIVNPKGAVAIKFSGAEERCVGFAEVLKEIAKEHATSYFDAGSVTGTSPIDGVHLDESQHLILGKAIAQAVLANNLL